MPTFTNANEALPALMHQVLTRGTEVESRNGLTKELMMQQVTLTNPVPAEITVPGRRVSLPAQIAETMWLIAGRNDIEWLSHYLPRAAEFSDDGKTWRGGYGPRIRDYGWAGTHVDQLAHVVELLKVTNPDTRRAVINIYNPMIDTAPGKDIPCNNWVHFIPRGGVLHAQVAIRSNDLMWGWSGINAFEWTSLLTIVAGLTELQPGSITFSISSLHLYEQHWGKAQSIVTGSEGVEAPRYTSANPEFSFQGSLEDFDGLVQDWFRLEGCIRNDTPFISNAIEGFPEPMLRSWLQVLHAWHRDSTVYAADLMGTSLFQALALSPKRKVPAAAEPEAAADHILATRREFTQFASELHADKHKAYGNSWKKRGEMLGIMANCARKVDRLGVAGGGDSSADTAIDLLMYLIKYSLWLRELAMNTSVGSDSIRYTEGQEHVIRVDAHLDHLKVHGHLLRELGDADLITEIRRKFDTLEHWVEEKRADRLALVGSLVALAYPLAVRLWAQEERDKANAEGQSIEAWQAANATRAFTGYAQEGEV